MTETNNSSESRVTQTEQQLIGVEESKGIKRLHTIDSDVLFEKQLEKRRFIVEGLLPEGLTMLAGAPKAGKSFFALSLSVSVAKGIPFLCFPTSKCNVLYFCFEDDEKRLQQRLFEMSDENFTGLSFCNEVLRLGDGFSVFRKDGSLPKLLLTLMENDSKNTSDPPSENIPDSSVKSLDSDGNL